MISVFSGRKIRFASLSKSGILTPGMNIKTPRLVLVCSLLAAGAQILSAQQAPAPAAPAPTAPATIGAIGPKIQFQTPVYDFGKVKSGEPVKYTFIFTNTGDELLILTNVQPSCGCTTAGDWSRQVEPGKTGTIPVQFNSANYGGQVLKTVTVTSNDKTQPSVGLQLKGTVWKPVDVQPQFAVMTIPAETQSNVTTKVHIVNNMEEPITLQAPESSNKGFTAELKTNTVGKDFEMIITASPPFEQPTLQGQITLKTSSTNVPTLSVTAWANVQQSVVVSPPQVMLPAGPLANKQTVSLAIQNNSSKPLKLTEPVIDAKGVEVTITEPNPGRSFTATLNFPQGFEMAQGTKAEFSVKSDNPKFAVIKVPVTQMAKPVIAPVAAQPARVVPLAPGGATPVKTSASSPAATATKASGQ